MRILLSPEGTRGDVHPLLALGEVCRDAGHQVLLCAPPNFEGVARARGFGFHSSGLDVEAALADHAGGVVGGGLALARAQRVLIRQFLARSFDRVVAAAAGADLIIASGVSLAAPTAAELHAIPHRYVAYCPALLPSREHAPALLPSARVPDWAIPLAWRCVPFLFRTAMKGINAKRRELGLAPAGEPLSHLFGPQPVLMASDADLAAAPADSRFAVEPIGALQADDEGALPEKLEAFLDAGPTPIYIGFGSMTDPAPAETTRILLDAIERSECRAVVSRGWAGLGEGGLPEHVIAADAVSHTKLFTRVAAVVHHGGAGTTTRAARAGVPQIVVPHLMDQFYWAERVRALGLGPPPVNRRRLNAASLAEAISATRDNDVVAERAAELGARLRRSDPLRPENRETLLDQALGT